MLPPLPSQVTLFILWISRLPEEEVGGGEVPSQQVERGHKQLRAMAPDLNAAWVGERTKRVMKTKVGRGAHRGGNKHSKRVAIPLANR